MNFKPHEAISQLEYNTDRKDLVIPEYGRHLQKLIDQVIVIKDRDERNKAARNVIDIMGTINPHLRDVLDFQHKLWDQLFKMSRFELDVDSPYPKPNPDLNKNAPILITYPANNHKYRFYGTNIVDMIHEAISWEEGEKKDALIMVIANHMKKSYLNWNKDTVDDEVIFNHLLELSNGKINLLKKDEELNSRNNLMKQNSTNKNNSFQNRPNNNNQQKNNSFQNRNNNNASNNNGNSQKSNASSNQNNNQKRFVKKNNNNNPNNGNGNNNLPKNQNRKTN
ncbi:DUF4290 domain-containing protein [Flavobacterium sp. xlx-214]|uniref:DUF4290 domain-containing protein n=1 Tax=unclassified Flavobacterium TaxID=196869 RepID=UPI0013D48883|nr:MULTISPECIES: DUF4290 domain-containing protein [unclassified Flavobacterium]MBA5793242.1 DUF4290 domain-containing protein [Flavobacterium sp. xlx-221]QMI82475.1 DUF4290 domain-containing protein [Flavobacterium sp. xlx-214]